MRRWTTLWPFTVMRPYDLFMQMSDVIFSAQCDGASGMRIAQLEEIVSRALNVNWHEYDHPGDFKW